MKRWLIGLIGLAGISGCGSESTEDDPRDELEVGTSTVQVTILDGMIRGCTTQLSADQDGHPFGKPAEVTGLEADPGPAEATLFAYRTDEPPQSCPPTTEPFWTGAPGDGIDLSDAPIVFGPGTAFTLQADCDDCPADTEFRVTLDLAFLE